MIATLCSLASVAKHAKANANVQATSLIIVMGFSKVAWNIYQSFHVQT
jgi:hypothetical protein